MALGDLMASSLVHSSSSPSPSLSPAAAPAPAPMPNHHHHNHVADDLPVANGPEPRNGLEAAEADKPAPVAYLPQLVVLCDQRHEGLDEAAAAAAGPSTSGLVSKWRPKDRGRGASAARAEVVTVPASSTSFINFCYEMRFGCADVRCNGSRTLESIGKTLHSQYERWQPKARYKLQLDPTVEEVKKLCSTCHKYARSERVLFHYNGHGVPKPTSNGEIWVFNKSYMQYIPLPIADLDSWLKTPSIYVFDCSAAGIIVKAFLERLDWSSSSASSQKDCILLAACETHQAFPRVQNFLLMCLRLASQHPSKWRCTDLFQRLFRQVLLVASLFRNFLLAERIMRSANCSPISYPLLPPTHQHHMWDAWDMATEICLSKLPQLIADPTAEFQPSRFFMEQLTAFEVWLDHGSEDKKPPE